MATNTVQVQAKLQDQITDRYKSIQKNLTKLDKKIIKSLKKVEKQSEKTKKSMLSSLSTTKVLAAGLATFLTGKFVGAFIKAGSEVEDLTTQFKVLLGSAEAAENRMKELAKFAETTPFQLKDIADASRILQTLTKGALASGQGLRLVGDVAAATGSDFQNLALHIGRAYDGLRNNRPVGESMVRLQELGIVTGDVRAKIEQLTKQGLGVQAWELLETQLKKSEGGMVELSKTVTGLTSTIKDQLNAAMRQMMDSGVWDALQKALAAVVGKMNEMIEGGTFEAWGKGLKAIVDRTTEFARNLMRLRDLLHGVKAAGDDDFLSDPKVTNEVKNRIDKLIELESTIERLNNEWDKLNILQKIGGEAGRKVEIARNKALLQQKKLREEITQTAGEGFIREDSNLKALSIGLDANIKKRQEELKLIKEKTEEQKKPIPTPKIALPQTTKIKEQVEFGPGGDPEQWKKAEEQRKKLLKDAEAFELMQLQGARKITDEKIALQNKELENAKRNMQIEKQIRQNAARDFVANLQVLAQANKKFGALFKTAAITQTLVDTYASAQAAFKALAGIPIVGPALGSAAAITATAAGLARVSQIKSQRFQSGGIVEGTSFTGDRVPALLNSGEIVLNRRQQVQLLKGGTGNTITFEAPQITINGNTEPNLIQSAVEETYQEMINRLAEMLKETSVQEVLV